MDTRTINIKIETYINDSGWLAVLYFGSFFMNFKGAEEEEAINAAKNFYLSERARGFSSGMNDGNEEVIFFINQSTPEIESAPKILVKEKIKANTPVEGASQFAGKKWMGNRDTKERLRVDPSEVQKYLNDGWIFVGPRTKL